MKSYLTNLTKRERLTLIAGLLIGGSLLGYVLVIEPFQNALADYRKKIQTREADLTWMRQAAQEIIQKRQSADRTDKSASSSSPLAAVNKSARKLGLGGALNRVEPEGSDKVRIQMDEVLFDDVVRWLALLKSAHSIETIEFRAERRDRPGHVRARITLVRENS